MNIQYTPGTIRLKNMQGRKASVFQCISDNHSRAGWHVVIRVGDLVQKNCRIMPYVL